METKIDAFIETPSEDAFDKCKDAWLPARTPYAQTEVYCFYDGPIDNATDGLEDEHSCFSDNTHNDIILNFKGCENVLIGK